MSKFSEFVGRQDQPEAERPMGIVIDGAFMCHFCNDQVDEAEYFPVEKLLLWKCVEGHKSYIEEFSI